jgi:diaminopimelate epimerase
MHRSVTLSYVEDLIILGMGEAKQTQLYLQTDLGVVHYADTGVPHAVHFVSDVADNPIGELGHFLRHHPVFGLKGANAKFATIEDDGIYVRTFERGAEAETLAPSLRSPLKFMV